MTEETYPCVKCFIHVKSQFPEKIRYFPLRNSRLLYYPEMRYCYNTVLSNFRSIIFQVVAYWRLKKPENFKLLVLKALAVAYERWSLTRGSKYRDLTWKLLPGILENWSLIKGCCFQEVVATGGVDCALHQVIVIILFNAHLVISTPFQCRLYDKRPLSTRAPITNTDNQKDVKGRVFFAPGSD